MMDVTLTQLENSTEIFAEADTGNKQWVAIITDTHPKYNYEREFVAYQKPKTSKRDSGRDEISEGDVVEKVRYTHSGKNDTRRYYQFAAGELHQIDETEITQALEGVIVETEDDETHECQECGEEFDTEHGVAVHAGIVHSEDESEESDEAEDDVTTDADDAPTAIADGGLEVRDYRGDLERSDDLVRSYTTPPGERLYAYRTDDGDHHIVVSRGKEPGDRWEKRVPAERDRVVAGQQLWTIPDNWEKRAHVTRDSIAYGLFTVPETDHWVKLSIPTNDWLGDAWYGVKAVGDLSVEPVGELGTARDVHEIAREYEADGHVESAVAMGKIADNWDAVETDLEMTLEWVRDEGLDQQQPGDQPIRLSDDWELEFHQDRIFRPGEALGREVDLSECEIPDGVLLDELRNAGLIPSYYKFKLGLDDTVGMEYCMRALTEAGCSPPEALDYYMVEVKGLTQSGWADERGIAQPSVSKNVKNAKRALEA